MIENFFSKCRFSFYAIYQQSCRQNITCIIIEKNFLSFGNIFGPSVLINQIREIERMIFWRKIAHFSDKNGGVKDVGVLITRVF